MRCPVMQLSATVESMDITDRQATGTARAIHLTVNDRPYTLRPIPPESPRQAALAAQPDGHDEAAGG
jgi:hypothetical protein